MRLRAIRRLRGSRTVQTATGAVHFDESRGDLAHAREDVAEALCAEGVAYLPSPDELCPGEWTVRRRAGLGDVLALSAALRELARHGGRVAVTTHPNYRTVFEGFSQGRGGETRRPILFDGWLERHPGRWGRPAAACFSDWWNLDLPDLRPHFRLSEAERAWGREVVARHAQGAPRVLAVFARAGWETRTYLGWKEVAHTLARGEPRCAVLGFDGLVLPCCTAPDPMPLRELAAVMAACDLVLTGDSGPLHLAAALGVPSVAVFCATNPEGVVGTGYDVTALTPQGLDCWPCWGASCRVGEVDTPGSCVRALDPAQVITAARERLATATQEPERCVDSMDT